jgi:hypothetical protein
VATGHSIEPFPTTINRAYFAAYLSGFTDGEGCFQLLLTGGRSTPTARFSILLRADDLPILRLIQSFLACGHIDPVNREPQRRTGMNACDSFHFWVERTSDLVGAVIPHFAAHPLLAKKRRDLAIWSEGVALISRVSALPRNRNGRRGNAVRWTADLLSHFRSLKDALKATREFNAPIVALPPPLPTEPSLFDEVIDD